MFHYGFALTAVPLAFFSTKIRHETFAPQFRAHEAHSVLKEIVVKSALTPRAEFARSWEDERLSGFHQGYFFMTESLFIFVIFLCWQTHNLKMQKDLVDVEAWSFTRSSYGCGELDPHLWSLLPRELVALILSFICCPMGHLRQIERVDARFNGDLCTRFPVVHSRAFQRYAITNFKRCHHAAMEYRYFHPSDVVFSRAPIRPFKNLEHKKERLLWWHNNF